MSDQKLRTETQFWPSPDLEETQERLNDDDLSELFEDLQEYESLEKDSKRLDEKKTKGLRISLDKALRTGDEDIFEQIFPELKEFAKDEVNVDYQPDWAWSLFSYKPEEVSGPVLEVPSGGEHKGVMLTESGDRIGLYPKENPEDEVYNSIADWKHVERWALNLDNLESVGLNVASPEYDRIEISGPQKADHKPITMLSMDFNGRMVRSDNLKEFLKSSVPEEKAKEVYDHFRSKRFESILGRMGKVNWEDRLESGELDHDSSKIRYFDTSEYGETSETPEEHNNSLFPLELAIESGEFVCTGLSDFTNTTGNTAYIIPDNWNVGRVEPEDVYDNSQLVIVDLGEYSNLMTEEMREEDYLIDDETDGYFEEDEEVADFQTRKVEESDTDLSIY